MSNKVKVIVTRKLPNIVETRLMELFDCKLNLDDHQFSHQELIQAFQEYQVVVPTVTDKIDAEIINSAGAKLGLIASYGNGYDHIDLLAMKQKKIFVSNTPDVLTEDTADMTMALICAVTRRITEGERLVRSGNWTGWSPTSLLGQRIWSKRLGIIGMGRIGMAVAKRANGFGLSVHYHNRKPLPKEIEAQYNATYWQSLEQMIAHMDIISVHCPHTPATYHLLNERRLAMLKPSAYLINTARGEIIDEKTLIKMLKTKKIAGAGLDVYESEPHINPQLLKCENVVLLPHLGSSTIEGRIAMGERVIINIKTFADGHTPPDRVIDNYY